LRLSTDDCFRLGLLVRVPPSKEKALKSIHKAKKFLSDAQVNLKSGLFDATVILAYLAMFHAARSLLIRDGIREKSHVCVVRYLEDDYAKKGKVNIDLVLIFDRYRSIRHSDQYDVGYFATRNEANEAVSFATELIKVISSLVSRENSF
jgi:uncharacterized protein (UPF0332 family)